MVSVVIPAYNESRLIGKCLEALCRQNTTRSYEVILVDNGSTDDTREIANSFVRKIPLRIVVEMEKGRAAARSAGFEVAKGEIILSTDADTVVPEDWIETMANYLSRPGNVAVTGSCKIVDCTRLQNVLHNFLQPRLMDLWRGLMGHYWLSGFNFGIYKSVYEQAGGFDRELNSQEDVDLSRRVSKLGKIKFIRDLPVIYSGRRYRHGVYRGMLSYVKNYFEIYILKRVTSILPDIR